MTTALLTWACATGNPKLGSDTQASDWEAPFSVVEQVWAAAARGDAASLAAVTDGEDPSDWIQARRMAYPGFFQETVGRLRLENGYVLDDTGTVVVQFRAPFVSCPPPVHEGVDDTYFAKVRPQNGTWRVIEVWMNIC
jgi:hypothetical protein